MVLGNPGPSRKTLSRKDPTYKEKASVKAQNFSSNVVDSARRVDNDRMAQPHIFTKTLLLTCRSSEQSRSWAFALPAKELMLELLDRHSAPMVRHSVVSPVLLPYRRPAVQAKTGPLIIEGQKALYHSI